MARGFAPFAGVGFSEIDFEIVAQVTARAGLRWHRPAPSALLGGHAAAHEFTEQVLENVRH